MKTAIVIVFQEDTYNSLFEVIFEDLRTNPDVYFVYEKSYPESGLYKFLPSRKLKQLSFGLSNRLYCYYYNLPILVKELSKKYEHISILMHNASLVKPKYPMEMIDIIKRDATLNLLYLDTHDHNWVCSYANYLVKQNAFEKVFTIDPKDAQKYRMILTNTPYSKKKNSDKNDKTNQIYFCGTDAGRMFSLFRIWQEARKKEIRVKYDLSYADHFKDFFEQDSNVNFFEFLPYEKVLKSIFESSCILELVQKDQSALTVRPYEAVVYNKKLLTNNKSIFNFKYFDDRYMRFFEKIEDIDWDWIIEDIDVNYNYQGEFSPIYLLEKLA